MTEHVWTVAGLALVTVLAFWPVVRNDFVNWDDPAVILQNQQLSAPGVVAWAFSTTLIGHYQPLAWLAWAALKRIFGPNPAAFHAISLSGHVVNGILVYLIAWRLDAIAGGSPRRRRITAVLAALAFAVHPVRVETVAWASAFPYVLSLAAVLVAFLAYIGRDFSTSRRASADRHSLRGDGQPRLATLNGQGYAIGRSAAPLLTAAIGAYAVSLLLRASAIGFPLVLLAVDVNPLRRRLTPTVLLEKLPFVILAIGAAAIESRAREVASLQDVGVGARLTMAAVSPFAYLGRTVFPLRLSPLDALPISPAVDWMRLGPGVVALAAVAFVAWRMRQRWPALAVGSIAYVLFLAPVVGLIPSGLQATADRYMYLPGVSVALLIAIAVVHAWPRDRVSIEASLLAAAAFAALGVLTWQQTRWWHDSITLWSRAADLDPRNDVATYNLAIALADAGREAEAISRYEQTLRIVPDHALARANLNALQARQAERDGDRLADAGRLDEAERSYSRALALDAARLHARAARGIVLTRLGHPSDAVADLHAAYDANVQDAAVVNALAYALTETSRSAEAAAVLKRGVDRYPDDVNLAHNLARLLATAADTQVRDGPLALRLALAIRDRTGGADPRVLDTLAAAYAATGRFDLARDTASQAAARARQLGDAELAVDIAAHAKTYGKR